MFILGVTRSPVSSSEIREAFPLEVDKDLGSHIGRSQGTLFSEMNAFGEKKRGKLSIFWDISADHFRDIFLGTHFEILGL